MKARTSRTPSGVLRKIRVRPALQKDGRAASALLKMLHLEHRFDQKEFRVAEHMGRLVGCARLKFLGDCYELASVAVSEGYRGKGVGTLLVKSCLENADDRVYLLTREPKYFSRFGFRLLDVKDLPSELKRKLASTCDDDASAMLVDAGNPALKMIRTLKEKTAKDLEVTRRAIEKVKIAAPARSHYRKAAEDFLNMAKSYYSDALHFLKSGNTVLAMAAVNYAHGWLDAGARLGLFDVDEDDQLFTLAE